jgi:hypothetical protein
MLDSIDVIKLLLMQDNRHCPLLGLEADINLQEVIRLSQFNKCTHILFHFIECSECRKRLHDKEINKLIQLKLLVEYRQQLLRKEEEKLIKFSKPDNLRIVFYKNSPFDIHQKRQKICADIDVLVTPETQKKLCSLYTHKGYVEKTYPPKEISLFHKNSPISVDVHTLIVYPHYGDMRKTRLASIQDVSKEMYMHAYRNKKTGSFELDTPHYLIFLPIYFWYNDLGFGLSTLYTFLEALQASTDEELNQAVLIAKKHSLYSLFSFIATLSFRFFGIEIPEIISKRLTVKIRQKALVPFFLNNFVVTRYSITDWHSGKKNIPRMYLDYYLSDLILDDEVPFTRLVRFKVLFFYVRSVLCGIL